MSLSKFNENVNNVQSLPDKPNLTSEQLKKVFDQAGIDIKAYLNDTLTTAIDALVVEIQNAIQNNAGSISTNGEAISTIQTKLNGIENNANKYAHPTTSGNKHIPSGGSSGQILRWASDGTASWGADNNTTYNPATQSANGLMSAADKKKLDGIASGANAYAHPTTSGNKHIPSGGSSGQILRWASDGTATWGADNNTTYNVATTSANGLMSATDKTKLNGIASAATRNVITVGTSAPSGGSNGDIYIQYFN